jgi:hypothetical protein
MDIEKQQIERKPLGEDCWIDLPGDVRLRIDYMTEAQDSQLRKLNLMWQFNVQTEKLEYADDYMIRATVKEVQGLTIEGEPFKLNIVHGMIERPKIEKEEDRLKDFVSILKAASLYEATVMSINMRLAMSGTDKKKLKFADSLPSQPESSFLRKISTGLKSLIPGVHSKTG